MTNLRLPYLLNKYLDKTCSEVELEEFYRLVEDHSNDLEFNHLFETELNLTKAEFHIDDVTGAEIVKRILDYDEEVPISATSRIGLKSPKIYQFFKNWVAVAAAVLMLLSFGFYFFREQFGFKNPMAVSQLAGTKNIPAGGNKAVLSLANGQIIDLNTSKSGIIVNADRISYEDGSTIGIATGEKSNLSYQTLRTPRAGQYQINLPDGSKVWLNAASSLTFPETFAGSAQRIVELQGEAYFEIAKSKKHLPFIVKTDQQQVEVMGTHFNINAYDDEMATRTTLLEGAVRVLSKHVATPVVLKPGEESVLNQNRLTVRQVDTEQRVDWKNGKFIFKKESLEEILRKVARWYDVNIVYESEASKQETFSGTVSRFDDVQQVLRRLELTGEVGFRIQNRSIIVIK